MAPFAPQNDADPDPAILALVDRFLERRQAGEQLTPEGFAAEHPELADVLRPYLRGLALIDTACRLGDRAEIGRGTAAAEGLPTIDGYELIERIGQGGMGIVYKALQVRTKRIVALKVMRAGTLASASGRRRFEREVELAARLEHPAIARVLESGYIAQQHQQYYAMDYVAGVSLERYIARARPDLRATLRIFERLCHAVEHAHRRGVVHRDLKPANVIIDDESHPHILDFGLAKAIGHSDTDELLTPRVPLPGLVVGTLSYLAPEQAAGTPEEIDARTDVYALGVMLFEALTGVLPFDTTGRPAQVIRRMLETSPTRPSSLGGGVDDELETVILKALERDKANRYQSAEAMGRDIRRYLENEPLLARRPNSLYVLGKTLRKRRGAVCLGGAAVTLGVIGLLAGAWRHQHELAQARRDALRTQQALESQNPVHQLGAAQALHERHPELPEAGLVLAQALHRSGQQAGAIVLLESLAERDPSLWAHRALLAEMYRAAGDAARAEALAARAERDAPDTADAWYLRSFATLDRERARRCVEEAVQHQPAHVPAWERLTGLRLNTGDLEGALRGADRLIELGEYARRWNLFKGRVLVRQGRFHEAIEAFTRGEDAYIDRAHAYRHIKEYEEAVADYTRVLDRAGESPAAAWHYYQRATPLWILGRTDEAVEDYRRARILLGRPTFADARRILILREQGRTNEAQDVLDAALRDVENHWLRQVLRCLEGRLSPAELVTDGAARNNREQLCEAYYYAGEVCLRSGQLAEARKWFEQCVQTGVQFDLDTAPATPMNEYELAEWRLTSLYTDDTPISPPKQRVSDVFPELRP